MRLRQPSFRSLISLAVFILPATLGCGSKPHEVDTAEVSPDPSVKVPPAATAPGSTPPPPAQTPAPEPAAKP